MKKIIIHTSQEPQYKSLVRPLFASTNNFEILSTNIHQKLFDVVYKTKPDIIFLPASEYTQEFNDFIVDNSKVKVVIVLNVMIPEDKQPIVEFWKKYNATVVGPAIYCNNFINMLDNSLIFDRLYDSYIYTKNTEIKHVDKVAVLLSSDDTVNNNLRPLLYPNRIDKKIVLFNNPKFIHIQNLGLLSEPDLAVIMNSYDSIVDLDHRYDLESQVCGISNIDTSGDLKENILNKQIKPIKYEHTDKLSYEYYINHILSPKLLEI